MSKIATIHGNSPYSASLSLLPVILKSMPFGFLIPQKLLTGAGVTGTGPGAVFDATVVVVVGGGIVSPGCGRFGLSPPSGIPQHTSRGWGQAFSPNLKIRNNHCSEFSA